MQNENHCRTAWIWLITGAWPWLLQSLGGPHAMLSSLCGLIVLDYFSGLLASWYKGEKWDRRKAERGFAVRLAMFGAIWFSVVFDHALGCKEIGMSTHGKLRFAFLVAFNWHEAQSILRNFGLLGLTIPEAARKLVNSVKPEGGKKVAK